MLNRPIFTGVLILLLLALIPGGCAVRNATGLGMTQRSLEQQVALIAPHSELHLPENALDPVPAVVFLHGCGGVRAFLPRYAATALENGYAVLIVDSLGAREIGRRGALSTVCTGLRLWGSERTADVYAAIDMLRADPRIDPDRIALAGWSHGAWTILEAFAETAEQRRPLALDSADASRLDGVRGALLFYPYCGFPVRARGAELAGAAPIDAVMAGEDMIAPPGPCRSLFSDARAAGAEIRAETWTGLTHAFDEEREPGLDPRLRYDEGAVARARALLADWLRARI